MPMIEAGVELHEVRHDATMRTDVADTPPPRAEFMGLHSKGMVIDRDAQPASSWRVAVDEGGRVTWTNDVETVTRQPARGFRRRVEDVVFMAFPKELH